MNVLVLGSGGREHALAWKLSQSPDVETVFCNPGNGGIYGQKMQRLCMDSDSYEELAEFALANNVGLTVVGPEKALCDGIVDRFREKGLVIFGPDKYAAQLEGSKWFAKEFMRRHGIPTAAATKYDDLDAAVAHIRNAGAPIVVKADGLAAGKGVTVALTEDEAIAAVTDSLGGAFGGAGAEVVLEEYLEGEEASILAFVDHSTIKPLASSQDHKRLKENDSGPNTGGMGAYSPAPVVSSEIWKQVHNQVLTPFLNGCRTDNLDYRGIIYAGLMLTADGPKVLEFNVRFGDPEAQTVLMRMQSDLTEAMLLTVNNRLGEYEFSWSDLSSVCVVMVSDGYPGAYEKNRIISGIDDAEALGVNVFHAGTESNGDTVTTAGGRVLGVTASGATISETIELVYAAVDKIYWDGMYYRHDIAHKAIARV